MIAALQWVRTPNYETIVSAYGILTRVMTFAYLPLLGLTQAMQSIVGNNFGAHAWLRSDQSLRLGIWIAFLYCCATQLILVIWPAPIAALIRTDLVVIAEFERISPVTTAMLRIAGRLSVIAMNFQAIGNASRAAVLGFSRSYLFAIPLTFALPSFMDERGIWAAGPRSRGCDDHLNPCCAGENRPCNGTSTWAVHGPKWPSPASGQIACYERLRHGPNRVYAALPLQDYLNRAVSRGGAAKENALPMKCALI